ncbi:alcohol dehydrogenase catalytic domain-containing protein [Nakamurella sp. YIM 132087]|uniref:Alcohol dehydrogenase catalytic domain-containing protein n=1 Tax=Nakamurella alba TaxID=2665158 RepID=A0A7K1FQA4_9ACTN|nr:alcohol dehydrogenase catalytic domain-containing protein [Nakamurella alba]MTD16328.1 alcohol dehydrogenase catalytic domain-containing protein [Nakamurella alba]
MPDTYRRAVFTGAGHPIEWRRQPLPRPAEHELVVGVELAGICGTDVHRLAGDVPTDGPVAFGHEAVGRVLEIGDGAGTDRSGRRIRVGDRVLWNPVPACGRCRACTVERTPVRCTRARWPAPADQHSAAGFQEVALLGPDHEFHVLPDDVEEAAAVALGCALPTAIGGFGRLGGIAEQDVVVVQGSGPVGLASTVLAAQSPATRIVVIGTGDARLRAARDLGATATIDLVGTDAGQRARTLLSLTGGRGADVLIEAAGRPGAFVEGLDLLAAGGRYLLMGLFSGTAPATVDAVRWVNRSQHLIGSLGSPTGSFGAAVSVVQRLSQRYDPGRLVSSVFPLADLETAIAHAAGGTAIKTAVSAGPWT